jgi:hypothetical protein
MNLYFRPKTFEQAQLQLAVENHDRAKQVYLIQMEWFVLNIYGSSCSSELAVLHSVCSRASKP